MTIRFISYKKLNGRLFCFLMDEPIKFHRKHAFIQGDRKDRPYRHPEQWS
jgi:hypothetical protein